MGLGPCPSWRIACIMQYIFVLVFLCRPRATWKEAGAFLLLAWWCEALSLKSVEGAQFVVLFVYVVA